MGPAVLLCPPSAVQLLGQVSPSQFTRQKVYTSSNGNGRHLLYAHWRGDFFRRSTHLWSNVAMQSRRKNTRFTWRVFTAAVGEEIPVEEIVADENSKEGESAQADQPPKSATNGPDTDSAGVKTQRKRIAPRRDNRVRVANAALVPGATFTGKVTTIQSFGAFVDIGAFTNGLIHISRLSRGFVKSVEDVVQVGQDVNVEVLDADIQGKRISLMLKQEKQEQVGEGPARGSDREGSSVQQGRGARRSDSQRRSTSSPAATKLKKGETVTGVVKNIIKSGVFVTLPDSADGFLPASETDYVDPDVKLEAHFKVGQEVSVRVLRVERGRVRLSTKKELDIAKINESINRDLVGGATNPFEIAFRQNSIIASYLEEKQKLQDSAEGKGAKEEPDAAAKDVSEAQPSSLSSEEESEEPSDDTTVLPASASVMEKAADEKRTQGNVVSEKLSEGPTEKLQGKSLDPVADSVDEKIPKSTDSVDEAEGIKQAFDEGVQTAMQDSTDVEEAGAENAVDDRVMAYVEEVSAGKEAAFEGVADAMSDLAIPAGEASTDDVVAATEDILAPAKDTFGEMKATADEVVGDTERIAPRDESARESAVAAAEDSVAESKQELAQEEVTGPEFVSLGDEVSSLPKEAVGRVEDVVAAIEEAVAIVGEAVTVFEEGLAKPEIAVQEHEPPAEETPGPDASAVEETSSDVDMAVAALESVVAAVEDAVTAVKEELAEQDPVGFVKEAESESEKENSLISSEGNDDVLLKAEKAQSDTEADMMGAQKKVDQVQETELPQDQMVNKAIEETSQEKAEMDAFEVVGVNKQDN